MRETKFRVWDNVDYMSAPFTLQDVQDRKVQFTSDCVVMEYAGLMDSNGVEICEGDVCKIFTDDPTPISKINGAIGYISIGRFHALASHEWLFRDGSKRDKNITIIGNIYQDRLLKS